MVGRGRGSTMLGRFIANSNNVMQSHARGGGKRPREEESEGEGEGENPGSAPVPHHRLVVRKTEDTGAEVDRSFIFSRTSSGLTPNKMVSLTMGDVSSMASYLMMYGVTPIKMAEKECLFSNGCTSRDKTRICFRILKRSGFLAFKSGKYVIRDNTAIPSADDVASFAQAEEEERLTAPTAKNSGILAPAAATTATSSSSSSSNAARFDRQHLVEEPRAPPGISEVQLELARKLLCATSDARQHHHGTKLTDWANYHLQCSALNDVQFIINNYAEVSQHVLPDLPSQIGPAEEALQRGEVTAFIDSSIKDLQPALEEATALHVQLKEQLENAERRLSYLNFRMKEKAREQVKGWCEEYVKQMHEKEEACRMVIGEVEDDEKEKDVRVATRTGNLGDRSSEGRGQGMHEL